MDQVTTVKIQSLPKINELDFYQYKRDQALKEMLELRTIESIWVFAEADAELCEVQDKYRLGTKLLLFFKKMHPFPRRNYTSYNENQTFK